MDSSPRKCWAQGCAAEEEAAHRCKGCKQAVYCGRSCQLAHWNEGGHKIECQTLGDPLHPSSVIASGAHDLPTLCQALDRALLEAARDPLQSDDFLALGNSIADDVDAQVEDAR